MTSSERMTFSLDNNICNDLVQWTSVIMVSVLASYVKWLLVCLHEPYLLVCIILATWLLQPIVSD